jgi:aminopeptidase
MMFYNTLFDENAACHLALGRAYRSTMKGGEQMTAEQFGSAGGNDSAVHEDFMIGSGKLDIDGLTKDGKAEPILRKGEWAFKV